MSGFVICQPVGGGARVTPGSTTGCCDGCGDDVWIAPSAHGRLDAGVVGVVCVPCSVADSQAGPSQVRLADYLTRRKS